MAVICGLISEHEGREPTPVPLTGVSAEVVIIDLVAEVTIEQRYVNREGQPIEAVYKFPIDEGAAVCKFTAEVDGRMIEGVVKENKQAEADYQEAIQTGHSAFLVQETLPDVFKAKVGNLAPGSGAKIRITYVTELKTEGDEVRFFLPTTIAPRYIPANDKSTVADDLASINYTEQSHYQVEFDARIKMASAIRDIRSPTHQITVTQDPSAIATMRRVKLEKLTTSMDRDLVLYIKTSEPNQPRLFHEKSSNGTSALMLSIVPSFKLTDQKTELIFLVDRSGSMQGAGIEQAKRALILFLHSLPQDCYVNIAGFGFSYEELYPTSRKYDQDLLQQAKVYAEALQANLGGTEIHNPLERIFQKPPIEGYLRQVFVLTDGEVSNADQVLQLVRRNNSKARVFALGLGSSASHHLVEGMARAGNGTALFASLEERLEKKVMQQLQDALQPSMTDIKIKWDGYDDEATPSTATETREKKLRQIPCDGMIPPIFDGRHFVIYVLLEGNATIPKWGEIIALTPAGPLTQKTNITECVEGLFIHRLAAKKQIQWLQDRDDQSEAKSEIIRLSCQYGLASRHASFVAVDLKEQTEHKESWMLMKSRDIPVQVAHGYGGGARRFVRQGRARGPIYSEGSSIESSPCSVPDYISYNSGMSYGAPIANCAPLGVDSLAAAPVADVATFPRPMAAKSLARAPMVAHFSPPVPAPDVVDTPTAAPLRVSCLPQSLEHTSHENVVPNGPKELSDDDKLITLISSQKFDGSFELEIKLCQLLDSSVDDVRKAGQVYSYSDQVWATAIALAYMEVVLSEIEVSWKLVAKKAQNWLHSQNMADEVACKKAAYIFVKSQLNL